MNPLAIITWLSGWKTAHDELVRDGVLVYGRMKEEKKKWPPEGWVATISVKKALEIIDEFGNATAACVEDTTGNERLMHLAVAETLIDLRDRFQEEQGDE